MLFPFDMIIYLYLSPSFHSPPLGSMTEFVLYLFLVLRFLRTLALLFACLSFYHPVTTLLYSVSGSPYILCTYTHLRLCSVHSPRSWVRSLKLQFNCMPFRATPRPCIAIAGPFEALHGFFSTQSALFSCFHLGRPYSRPFESTGFL